MIVRVLVFFGVFALSQATYADVCEPEFNKLISSNPVLAKESSGDKKKRYEETVDMLEVAIVMRNIKPEIQEDSLLPREVLPLKECIAEAVRKGEIVITEKNKAAASAILAAAEFDFKQKKGFGEIFNAVDAYKIGVAVCYQDEGNFKKCNAGENGIPAKKGTITGNQNKSGINSRPVNAGKILGGIDVREGVVFAEAINGDGFSGETFIFTPTIKKDISWKVTGTCLKNESCKKISGF